ncbi:MAG: hypothetical protein ACRYG8_53910 [Janthinobacterium lividum]
MISCASTLAGTLVWMAANVTVCGRQRLSLAVVSRRTRVLALAVCGVLIPTWRWIA